MSIPDNNSSASISSARRVVSKTTPGEGVEFNVSYHGDEIITMNPFWHVLTGWEPVENDGKFELSHLLGIISESPYEELPEGSIPEGMTVVATFNYEPTREELNDFIPEAFRGSLVKKDEV